MKDMKEIERIKEILKNSKDQDGNYQIDDNDLKNIIGKLINIEESNIKIINDDTRKIISNGAEWLSNLIEKDDMFLPLKDIQDNKILMYELGKTIPVNEVFDSEDYSRCYKTTIKWVSEKFMNKLNNVRFYHQDSGSYDYLVKCEFDIENVEEFKNIVKKYYKNSIYDLESFEKVTKFEKYEDFTYAMDEWHISYYNKRIETPRGYLYVYEYRK